MLARAGKGAPITLSQHISKNIINTSKRCISTSDQQYNTFALKQDTLDQSQNSSSDEDKSELQEPRTYKVVNSLFQKYGSNKPPTLSFIHRDTDTLRTITDQFQTPYFKLDHYRYTVLRKAFVDAGFKRIFDAEDPEIQAAYGNAWNVYWGRHMSQQKLQQVHPFQKVNHWPGSSQLGRKDNLTVRLKRLEEHCGSEHVDFYPKTYLLPHDKAAFERDASVKSKDELYIIKPSAGSCGRGIHLMRPDMRPNIDKQYVVQEYVRKPYLINGHKFDLRLYVACTSLDPLRVYLHEDGLARFATQPYDEETIDDRFSHLTNYSLNRHAEEFVSNEDAEDEAVGHKWSLLALKKQLISEIGLDKYNKLMDDIRDLIVKTMLSVEGFLTSKTKTIFGNERRLSNCFELYGFDVMFDTNLKPWLIEVNIMPSLSCPSPLDRKIKMKVIRELFHLIGVIPYDRNLDVNKQYETLCKYDSHKMDEEKYMLQESEDELHRCVDFERIYPPTSGDVCRYNHMLDDNWWTTASLCNFEKAKQAAVDMDSLYESLV